MSNIAEGFENRTWGIFIDLLGRAKGSVGEVRCQLHIARDRKYIEEEPFDEILRKAEEISPQLHGFMRSQETLPKDSQIREDDVSYET
jgi:four helix bundle protein